MGNDFFRPDLPKHNVPDRIFRLGYAGHLGPMQSQLLLYQSETGLRLRLPCSPGKTTLPQSRADSRESIRPACEQNISVKLQHRILGVLHYPVYVRLADRRYFRKAI